MRGNVKFSIHPPTEGVLRSPIMNNKRVYLHLFITILFVAVTFFPLHEYTIWTVHVIRIQTNKLQLV